jgi:DNA-binding NarL/FixJ family response regulator
MNPFRILLADNHALVREGIKRILEKEPGLEVIGDVGDGLEVLEFLKTSIPDMVILEIFMPRLDGLKTLKEIKVRHPEVRALIVTVQKTRELLLKACAAGAEGYLLKENDFGDLLEAIEKIRGGGHYISNLMSNQIMDLVRGGQGRSKTNRQLTQREKAVLELLSQGKSSKEIAQNLSISVPTVHIHRYNLKKKLNISSNIDLIKYALQKGFAH